MILLLDNYDSFTYNIAQYLGELGCNIEVHRNDKITVEEIVRRKPERQEGPYGQKYQRRRHDRQESGSLEARTRRAAQARRGRPIDVCENYR